MTKNPVQGKESDSRPLLSNCDFRSNPPLLFRFHAINMMTAIAFINEFVTGVCRSVQKKGQYFILFNLMVRR
jgi:hypothetical protein